MRFHIVRTRDELRVSRADAPCDQVGVLKVANPYRTIVTLRDEVNETIAVAGLDMKLGVASCHFREHGREMRRAEREWYGDSQTATKGSGGEDRFLGYVDLGADSGGIVAERSPGFCERRPACGSCKQLDAKFRFKSNEPATDDRFGNAEPKRSR